MGFLEDTKLKEVKTPVWFYQLSSSLPFQPAAGTQCESTGGGMPPQTGDRAREPWGDATMEVAETNRVYVALHLPLCAHTPHVKPSDACTAALACQSQRWGWEGPQLPHKSPTTRSQRTLGRVIIKTWGGEKEKGLDLWGVLAGCENVLKALCESPDVERRVSEVGVLEAVGRTELGMCRWVGRKGRKGNGVWEMS